MLTLPLLLDAPPRAHRGPVPIRTVMLDERRVLAQELVHVFETLASVIGREAAISDPRVRAAARRYRAFRDARP